MPLNLQEREAPFFLRWLCGIPGVTMSLFIASYSALGFSPEAGFSGGRSRVPRKGCVFPQERKWCTAAVAHIILWTSRSIAYRESNTTPPQDAVWAHFLGGHVLAVDRGDDSRE